MFPLACPWQGEPDQSLGTAIRFDGNAVKNAWLIPFRIKDSANSSNSGFLGHGIKDFASHFCYLRPRLEIIVVRLRLAPAAFLFSAAERKGELLRARPLNSL